MPLDQNPFLTKVMESVDVLVGENRREAAEERQFDKQTALEDLRFERQEEQRADQAGQQQVDELTKAIQTYGTNVTAGAEGDPDMLKGMVDRRNALIKEGHIPSSVGIVPQVPQTKDDGKVLMDPTVSTFYKYDPNTKVKPETKKILHKAFRDYHKPKTTGGGDDAGGGDLLEMISKSRELVRKRITSGLKPEDETESLGVDQALYDEYLNDLQQIETDRRSGKITESEGRQRFVALGTFEQFLYLQSAKEDKSEKMMNKFEGLLDKALE